MSETPPRRAADWSPPDERGSGRGARPDGYGQRANPAQTPWEPLPRSAQRPAARDERTRRGGYDDGGYGQGRSDGYEDDARPAGGRRAARGSGSGSGSGSRSYDDGYNDPRASRGNSAGPNSPGGYDQDAPARGGTRRAGGSRAAGSGTRSREAVSASGAAAIPLGQRLGIAFAIGAVPALIVSFLCGAASANGSSRSIAGVSLNSQLLMYSAAAIPAAIAIIGALLRWRRFDPLALTWGFAVVAGLSWLALLFAAQVKDVIPHLTPLVTVPLVTGLAVVAGAYLTDDETPANGRYACLAAVIASHIGIVAIVITIVLA